MAPKAPNPDGAASTASHTHEGRAAQCAAARRGLISLSPSLPVAPLAPVGKPLNVGTEWLSSSAVVTIIVLMSSFCWCVLCACYCCKRSVSARQIMASEVQEHGTGMLPSDDGRRSLTGEGGSRTARQAQIEAALAGTAFTFDSGRGTTETTDSGESLGWRGMGLMLISARRPSWSSFALSASTRSEAAASAVGCRARIVSTSGVLTDGCEGRARPACAHCASMTHVGHPSSCRAPSSPIRRRRSRTRCR